MNKTTHKKEAFLKFYVLFLLSAVAAILILAFFVFGLPSVDKEDFGASNRQLSLTPPQVANLSPQSMAIKEKITKTDKSSGDLSLQNNPDFEVVYLISNDQFVVTVKASPYKTVKQKAENWFLNEGFSSEDLCKLKLSFSASKEIKPDFLGQDAVPSGCPSDI